MHKTKYILLMHMGTNDCGIFHHSSLSHSSPSFTLNFHLTSLCHTDWHHESRWPYFIGQATI